MIEKLVICMLPRPGCKASALLLVTSCSYQVTALPALAVYMAIWINPYQIFEGAPEAEAPLHRLISKQFSRVSLPGLKAVFLKVGNA